jgi:hypothetical protein
MEVYNENASSENISKKVEANLADSAPPQRPASVPPAAQEKLSSFQKVRDLLRNKRADKMQEEDGGGGNPAQETAVKGNGTGTPAFDVNRTSSRDEGRPKRFSSRASVERLGRMSRAVSKAALEAVGIAPLP